MMKYNQDILDCSLESAELLFDSALSAEYIVHHIDVYFPQIADLIAKELFALEANAIANKLACHIYSCRSCEIDNLGVIEQKVFELCRIVWPESDCPSKDYQHINNLRCELFKNGPHHAHTAWILFNLNKTIPFLEKELVA